MEKAHDLLDRRCLTPTGRPAPVCRRVRMGNRSVLSRVPLDVFGADIFGPFAQRMLIGYGRGPGHGKDLFILHCEVEL